MTFAGIIALLYSNKYLRQLRKLIESGRGTFSDTFRYTDKSADLLGDLFYGSVLDMPDEERITSCVELLRDRHKDINGLFDIAQRSLDKKAGLSIAPQHVPFDEERAKQIGTSLTDKTVPENTIQRRAKSATANATRSMHDDCIEANAKFRAKAGLQCYITRTTDGSCCKWCTQMAGRYEYGSEPKNVYRRHDNCGCMVTYENGRKRQNVWSKKTWEVPADDAGAPPPVVFTQEQAAAAGAPPPKSFTKEEAQELNSANVKKNSAKADSVHNSSIDNSGESGIIKAITIKDFDAADKGGVISDECKDVIISTLKSQGVSYVYDDVKIICIPRDEEGRIEPLRTNAISRPRYPKVVLEVNEEALAGKSMEKIDEMFALQDYSVANSLEEAIIHESAHAKVIDGRSYEEYEEIDTELKGYKFTEPIAARADKKSLRDLAGEISEYAQKDGLECISECHVKLSRGETIPAELKELHDRFIK
jgi:hypothetical protein